MSDPKNPSHVEEPQAAYDPAVAGVHAAHQLEQSGFGRLQADAVVVAVRELTGDLVTKEDLGIAKNELRAEMAELKNELRTEIADAKNELRAEIATVKSELRTEMAELKGAIKSDLAHLEARLNKNAFRNTMWTAGILAAFMLATVGIATTLILAALPS